MAEDRRPTLSDVAAAAGVSKSLVSLVMRGEAGVGAATRERVREAAELLGYQPDSRARLLRSGRTRLIGVVFGIQHTFHADLVTELYAAARETGYELALSAVTPGRAEREAMDNLLRDRCEALIVLGPETPAAALGRLAERLPVVVMARAVRHQAVDVVRNADADGVRLAVDHLVGLGHRRIAHIDGGLAPGAADRRRGYHDAMHRHGLDGFVRIIPGGLTEEDGATSARELLGSMPSAVTVFNDRCATGVLDILTREGVRVPADLSVVGYDDDRLARLAHINLTTIAQDTATMSRLAVERAIERAEQSANARRAPSAAREQNASHDRSGPREQVVKPRLVQRGTTDVVAR